jgi:hypothetical protein
MQEKQLTFTFHYDETTHTLPTSIGILPNPNELDDHIILFILSIFIQVLRNRHGLEQALKMTEDVGYGKIAETEFDLKWVPRAQMEHMYGDLELPEEN